MSFPQKGFSCADFFLKNALTAATPQHKDFYCVTQGKLWQPFSGQLHFLWQPFCGSQFLAVLTMIWQNSKAHKLKKVNLFERKKCKSMEEEVQIVKVGDPSALGSSYQDWGKETLITLTESAALTVRSIESVHSSERRGSPEQRKFGSF